MSTLSAPFFISLDGVVEAPETWHFPYFNDEISVSGSASLGRSLLDADLVDELRLMVHPVVVGRGERLFGDGVTGRPLELVDSQTFATGVLNLTYRAVA